MLFVHTIDKALKDLYHLESHPNASDFLLDKPFQSAQNQIGASDFQGALYVEQSSEDEDDLSLGIYLNPELRKTLESFSEWKRPWSTEQLNAFFVASEEISHFHYLIFHASRGRSVSQFELELQGEIDKFLLSYFTLNDGNGDFHTLFDRLFFQFRLSNRLTQEQKDRYLDANRFAKRFILKCRRFLDQYRERETGFRLLRRFYRLNSSEKISYIHER